MAKIKTKNVPLIVQPEKSTNYKVVDASGNEVVNYQKDKLNDYQQFLFERAFKGINVYSPEQIETMNVKKKQRILNVSRRAHNIVNLWKQEKLIEETNAFMQVLFPKSSITKDLINSNFLGENENEEIDPKFRCKVDLADFRDTVSKSDIIEKFKLEGVLPKDFDTLVDFY